MKETVNQIGLRKQVTALWVSGHSGIDGNEEEEVDDLARNGLLTADLDPIILTTVYLCKGGDPISSFGLGHETGVHVNCQCL